MPAPVIRSGQGIREERSPPSAGVSDPPPGAGSDGDERRRERRRRNETDIPSSRRTALPDGRHAIPNAVRRILNARRGRAAEYRPDVTAAGDGDPRARRAARENGEKRRNHNGVAEPVRGDEEELAMLSFACRRASGRSRLHGSTPRGCRSAGCGPRRRR
jgi:hypothetical protein